MDIYMKKMIYRVFHKKKQLDLAYPNKTWRKYVECKLIQSLKISAVYLEKVL